jgi:hypothetical protein
VRAVQLICLLLMDAGKPGDFMKAFFRNVLAVVLGMGLAFVLVVLVEMFSNVVHPLPAELKGNIPEHVRRYPDWVLGVVVLAYGVAAAAATWVAARVGSRAAGVVVALLLGWALVFNLSMLPYTLWFKVVMPSVLAGACFAGIRWGKRAG